MTTLDDYKAKLREIVEPSNGRLHCYTEKDVCNLAKQQLALIEALESAFREQELDLQCDPCMNNDMIFSELKEALDGLVKESK